MANKPLKGVVGHEPTFVLKPNARLCYGHPNNTAAEPPLPYHR